MRKRGIVLLILVSTVLTGGVLWSLLWKPDPTELLNGGLEQLHGATSFRYTLTQHQMVDGNDRLFNQISGEKEGDNTRITGEILGTKVEMVLTGEGLYMQDPFTRRWIRYPSVSASHEAFLAELNPVSVLEFESIGEVMLEGQEKIDNLRTWVVKFNPTVQNPAMTNGWTDFSYLVFIGKRDKQIYRVIVDAKSKLNTKNQFMSLTLDFRDYGEKMDIQIPNL